MLNAVFESLSPTTVGLIAVIIVFVVQYFYSKSRSPGPWGIPFFGFYPFLREDYPVQMTEMSKKYGDPYMLSIAGRQYLHLGSHKALREAYVTKSEFFANRSSEFSIWEHLFGESLFFGRDEDWRVWRKFLGQSLRELGIGAKEQLKEPILNAVGTVLDTLKKSQGQAVDITDLITTQCVEIVRGLILGYNVSSDTAMKISQFYVHSITIMGNVGVLLFGDFARRFLLPRCKGYEEMLEAKKKTTAMFLEIIEAHKKNFDPQHPQDLIDLYLCEKHSRKQKNDPQVKYFTDQALASTLLLVYGDGSMSIAALIVVYLKVLASKPEVQDAIYEEIVSQIGTERLPTYEDKSKLPYTCSVIKEIERVSSFLSVIPSVECNRDTTILGVHVPKGAITLINYHSIHGNPEIYRDPETFKPDRFMADAKNKNTKVDMPVLFSIGKRACAGESFVMTEVFMFLTAILQQFRIQREGDTDGKLKLISDITELLDWKMVAHSRKHNI